MLKDSYIENGEQIGTQILQRIAELSSEFGPMDVNFVIKIDPKLREFRLAVKWVKWRNVDTEFFDKIHLFVGRRWIEIR